MKSLDKTDKNQNEQIDKLMWRFEKDYQKTEDVAVKTIEEVSNTQSSVNSSNFLPSKCGSRDRTSSVMRPKRKGSSPPGEEEPFLSLN